MLDSVTVTANARLHLGFLDLNGELGRRYGSLGLAVDRPVTRLTLRRSHIPFAQGPQAERAAGHLTRVAPALGLKAAYSVIIEEAIPSHAGLGSGTQLALATAAALRRLEGLPQDVSHDARLLRRGARSGIGLGIFERGGLIVDGGHGAAARLPPIITRMEFPAQWRIILVLDPNAEGVHGSEEQLAFASLPAFPANLAGEICRLVLMKALPALAEHDIGSFGDAVARLQEIIGTYFAPAQGGGAYSSAPVAALMEELRRNGAKGTGQSSWGPTGFAFAENAREARRLSDLVQAAAAAAGLNLMICKGLNHGALIQGEAFATIK